MSMHYRVNGYMTLDTYKPGYQIVGQKVKSQGHWGKCKKNCFVYIAVKSESIFIKQKPKRSNIRILKGTIPKFQMEYE